MKIYSKAKGKSEIMKKKGNNKKQKEKVYPFTQPLYLIMKYPLI